MSNVRRFAATAYFRTLSRFRFREAACVAFLASVTACRAPTRPELAAPPLEKPLLPSLGIPDVNQVDRLEIAARDPGAAPWRVRLEKTGTPGGPAAIWMVTYRSDGRPPDLADPARVARFLDVLSTFRAEATAPRAEESAQGFAPYRTELRLTRADRQGRREAILRLGESIGNAVVFRRDAGSDPGREPRMEAAAWVGRGALLPFLGQLRGPETWVYPFPWRAPITDFDRFTLEKIRPPGAGRWEFNRCSAAGHAESPWCTGKRVLPEREAGALERLLHQRLAGVLTPAEAAAAGAIPESPDWILRAETSGAGGSPGETLRISFAPGRIFGKNPERADGVLEFHPKFAGSLRDLTQFRSIPVQSGIAR